MPSEAAVRAHFSILAAIDPLGDPAGQKTVYACVLEDGTPAVLKIVVLPIVVDRDPDSEAAHDEAVGRLRREIDILASITSPYVTRLVYPDRELELVSIDGDSCAYYFEHRVPGTSVQQILNGGSGIPPVDVARMGAQVTRAVEEFWSRGTVHRDIKPANIMRDATTGDFILLDAGYALDLNAPSYTRVLGIVGTLPYFSPEQLDLANKRKLDFRSDLYALGVVMYCALSGQHPYLRPGMSQDEQLAAIANDRPAAPVMAPGTESLWEVILRLLEKQPHARYRSCEMVASILDQLY